MTEARPRSRDLEASAATEALRASFRPDEITTLFVGESAPINGTFFYDGNSLMLRYMQRAVEAAIPDEGDFLHGLEISAGIWTISCWCRSITCSAGNGERLGLMHATVLQRGSRSIGPAQSFAYCQV
ncbi:hypothetical protein [Bradyrhizobium japonicum]|uniref:hypothetical protein n=1 Tax=Bradyrhizobium japonicum TaxID=375 RepID=UPI000576ECF7|nr:hypothetical protein [Bradyrhizobium japonicum]